MMYNVVTPALNVLYLLQKMKCGVLFVILRMGFQELYKTKGEGGLYRELVDKNRRGEGLLLILNFSHLKNYLKNIHSKSINYQL